MTGEKLAAMMGEGWEPVNQGPYAYARKGHVTVRAGRRQYYAAFNNNLYRVEADGVTPEVAVRRVLLAVRRSARIMLEDIDAVIPGISGQ